MPRPRTAAPRLRGDFYHRLLTAPWSVFFAAIAVAYLAFNGLFALLYRLEDGSIANTKPGFADAFFFSVQTMATIGYGDMRPATLYANVLVSLEVLLGLVGFALATGVIFNRFSRPTARVMFSRIAVVSLHDGRPTLMFRAANQRKNRILEAHVSLTLARNEVTEEGEQIRRLRDLTVERQRTPLFRLSWTVMHTIGEESPLRDATRENLAAQDAELIATIIGIDETMAQPVHARHSYAAEDILFGRRFADIIVAAPDGSRIVDFTRFHDTMA